MWLYHFKYSFQQTTLLPYLIEAFIFEEKLYFAIKNWLAEINFKTESRSWGHCTKYKHSILLFLPTSLPFFRLIYTTLHNLKLSMAEFFFFQILQYIQYTHCVIQYIILQYNILFKVNTSSPTQLSKAQFNSAHTP